jgi:hypothetical protein
MTSAADDYWTTPPPPPPQAPSVEEPADAAWPEPIGRAAYYGIIGEIVEAIAPETEADPAAIHLQTIAYAGNKIGREPHYRIQAVRHGVNFFVLLAGNTAKARKGTSEAQVRQFFDPDDWLLNCNHTGLSSGEGLINVVRDAVYKLNPKTGIQECVDEGVKDKRALIVQSEFASPLTVMERPGNTLSSIMRDAWDGRVLRTMTKNSPLVATDHHISVIGHITEGELRRRLDTESMANGFGNRFLFGCVQRARILPHGGEIDPLIVADLAARLDDAVAAASAAGQVTMTALARNEWSRIYTDLSEERSGLAGALLVRGEAHVLRLSLLYALLETNRVVDGEPLAPGEKRIGFLHLQAAYAVWRFCQASVEYLFSGLLGDPIADPILRALRDAGAVGMSRTEIYNLLGRNTPADRIQRALNELARKGRIRKAVLSGTNRPGPRPERWFYVGGRPAP